MYWKLRATTKKIAKNSITFMLRKEVTLNQSNYINNH